jgi:hypothetical protein
MAKKITYFFAPFCCCWIRDGEKIRIWHEHPVSITLYYRTSEYMYLFWATLTFLCHLLQVLVGANILNNKNVYHKSVIMILVQCP